LFSVCLKRKHFTFPKQTRIKQICMDKGGSIVVHVCFTRVRCHQDQWSGAGAEVHSGISDWSTTTWRPKFELPSGSGDWVRQCGPHLASLAHSAKRDPTSPPTTPSFFTSGGPGSR
jgi:hypothetical protein